ncbi:hypothetical protein HY229_01625 [Candidatus Acetothermia bacterium]|nr:hypothetical protein [Candidatus Acetothermia bacterium]MBI3642790.1 hypothetical protein [Candidatus Acetothermia bacterium]
MSSKFKVLSIALVAIFALGFFTMTTKADVTGSFVTHISIHPQSTATELSVIDFDIENALNVTVVISGLSTSFHTHFGIAGIEDVILTASATLGALDLNTILVFCRFAYGSTVPFYPTLHFCKKYVKASLSLGGVTFVNEAQFEDTNLFINLQTAYAFGDVVTLTGQTPSGISITAQTGLCMQRIPDSIKKHFAITPYTVNPDCATTPKPDILFDFERMTVSGVPLAPGVTGSSVLSCVTINACVFTMTAKFAGGPIPFTAKFTFTDLLSLTFGGATLTLSSGSGQLVIGITPVGTIGAVGISVVTTLNADTNPATLEIDADIAPGVGLTDAVVSFTVERAGLVLGVTATFSGGPPALFDGITFSASVSGSALSLDATTTFTPSGMVYGEIFLTVTF